MKNLYRSLGIPSHASTQQIRSAIFKCRDSRLQQDAKYILNDPKTKPAYDEVNGTLETIGFLRDGLKVKNEEGWNHHLQSSYGVGITKRLRKKKSAYAAFCSKYEDHKRYAKWKAYKQAQAEKFIPRLMGLVALSLVGVAVYMTFTRL